MEALKKTLLGHMENIKEENLTPDFKPFEAGLDSLGVLVLMAAVSEDYGVDVNAKELKEASTLEGIMALILSKKA